MGTDGITYVWMKVSGMYKSVAFWKKKSEAEAEATKVEVEKVGGRAVGRWGASWTSRSQGWLWQAYGGSTCGGLGYFVGGVGRGWRDDGLCVDHVVAVVIIWVNFS
jgi:hypothetical protein